MKYLQSFLRRQSDVPEVATIGSIRSILSYRF